MRLRILLPCALVALPLALWALLPVGSAGDDSPGKIQRKIDRAQSLIAGHRKTEHILTTDISAYTNRIHGLQADISRLEGRQQRLQTDLDAKRAELARVQQELRHERLRLARLRARLLEARRILAARLVQIYKSDKPDLVNVVLEADGFADLLERTEFLHRVSRQDAHIIGIVRAAKEDATRTAQRLDTLERREAKVAAIIEGEVDQVRNVKGTLVDRRDRIQTARSRKSTLLLASRSRRHELEDDVGSLRKQQAAIQAKLAATAGSGLLPAGAVRRGSGGLIWPVNGPITSGFCEARPWESCHPGIDIGVPNGTPIRAAAAGKVVLMQPESASGGYGNFTCIQHAGPMSTCYAHQSRFSTFMGATVNQGDIIGYTGCTGRCFGPHLHFEVRINGAVTNPLNYL